MAAEEDRVPLLSVASAGWHEEAALGADGGERKCMDACCTSSGKVEEGAAVQPSATLGDSMCDDPCCGEEAPVVTSYGCCSGSSTTRRKRRRSKGRGCCAPRPPTSCVLEAEAPCSNKRAARATTGCCGGDKTAPATAGCGGNKPTPAADGCCGGGPTAAPAAGGSCGGAAEAASADGCCGGAAQAASADGCCGGTAQAAPADGCCGGGQKAAPAAADGCCGGTTQAPTGGDGCCSGAQHAVTESRGGCCSTGDTSSCCGGEASGTNERSGGCDKDCCGSGGNVESSGCGGGDGGCETGCCSTDGGVKAKNQQSSACSGAKGSGSSCPPGTAGDWASNGAGGSRAKGDAAAPVTVGMDIESALFTVSGMTCSGCVSRIESHLRKHPAVVDVNVSLLTCKARVDFGAGSGYSAAIAQECMEQLGFEVEREAANAHASLHVSVAVADPFADGAPTTPDDVAVRVQALCAAARDVIGVVSVDVMPPQAASGFGSPFPSLQLAYNPAAVGARDLLAVVRGEAADLVIAPVPSSPGAKAASATVDAEFKKTLRAVLVCLALCVPIIVLSVVCPLIPAAHRAIEWHVLGALQLQDILLWLCASPIQFWIGLPIYKMAWASLYHNHRANMDVLIVLSTTTAYIYSVVSSVELALQDNHATDAHSEEEFRTFFPTAAYLLTLILIGRLMNEHAKGKTSRSLSALMSMQPRTATLLRRGEDGVVQEEEIDACLVQRGDTVKVLPGAQVPTDGIVSAGHGRVDESMLTGEAVPVWRRAGDAVVGGTVNQMGTLHVKVTRSPQEGTLSQIVSMVQEAQTAKAPVQHTADLVASYFTPCIIAVAIGALVAWYLLASSGAVDTLGMPPTAFALSFSLTVLVVSCPCAIALAVPTAVMVATGVSARCGVLIKGGPPLQHLQSVTAVVLDKTGTITGGKPKVVKVIRPRGSRAEVVSADALASGRMSPAALAMLRLLGSAEQGSEHPLARAIVDFCGGAIERQTGEPARLEQPVDAHARPGRGLECKVGSRRVRVGKLGWFNEGTRALSAYVVREVEAMAADGITVVGIATEAGVVGILGLTDVERPESAITIAALQRDGVDVWMATGDQPTTAVAVARRVGIKEDRVLAGVLPADKADHVRLLQSQGHVVAMVGDGVNDSVALAAADVGIGMGGGTDIALETAQVVLLRDDLRDVLAAIQLSRATLRRIKLNFLWAFVYNVIAMPFAAGALFPFLHWQLPVAAAGLSEVLSSVPVILFSLLLSRFRPEIPELGVGSLAKLKSPPVPNHD